MDGEILRPRDKLARQLILLPLPSSDDDLAGPSHFFRRLIEPMRQAENERIAAEAMFADHQRIQSHLSDRLAHFHHFRALHSLEFSVMLAKHGAAEARCYLADIQNWASGIDRLIRPETSAVARRAVPWL